MLGKIFRCFKNKNKDIINLVKDDNIESVIQSLCLKIITDMSQNNKSDWVVGEGAFSIDSNYYDKVVRNNKLDMNVGVSTMWALDSGDSYSVGISIGSKSMISEEIESVKSVKKLKKKLLHLESLKMQAKKDKQKNDILKVINEL